MTHVKIFMSNSKMGKIPSVSLPAVKTCACGVPCAKKCYARRLEARFPAVRESYADNLTMYENCPARYFDDIAEYIEHKKPLAFRWHVSGDIPDYEYLHSMVKLAKQFPRTRFLAYTKKYDLVDEYIYYNDSFPANLAVRLSKWDGYELRNPWGLPVAYVQLKKGNTDPIPATARMCPHYINENWTCMDCAQAFCGCYGCLDVVLPEH